MTFLQLCQRLILECGISGESNFTTVVGNSGEFERVVTWVNAASLDIQSAHQDWDWMRQSASFATVAGQATYELGSGAGTVGVTVAAFNMWARDTARNYVTSVGTNSEIFMDHIGYDAWRNTYMYGALRTTTTRPVQFAISPTKALCMGPPPVVGYTITCDYYTAPVDLALDVDVPLLPTQWQMAIIYRAMMFYGAFEAAPEVYNRGETEFQKVMNRLDHDRLPEIVFAGALA